jgi:hypothetical protein
MYGNLFRVNEKTKPNRLDMLRAAWKVGYGFPDEWEHFARRNCEFIQAYPELMAFCERIFSPARTYSLKEPSNILSFALLCLAQRDFQEILRLAVNADGGAARARVRTTFERVVLAAFFIKYPGQAEPYAYFSTVEQRKNLIRALKMYSRPEHSDFRERLQERVKELDKELKELKRRYGKQFSYKWIDAGFEKLCEEVGLKSEFLYSYLIPNTFVHACPSQLLEAVAREQQYFVESGPDRANADEALKSAHSLLVWSFAVADDLLELHMAAEVAKLVTKCVETYQNRPSRLAV